MEQSSEGPRRSTPTMASALNVPRVNCGPVIFARAERLELDAGMRAF
jgi:hypothetical protein